MLFPLRPYPLSVQVGPVLFSDCGIHENCYLYLDHVRAPRHLDFSFGVRSCVSSLLPPFSSSSTYTSEYALPCRFPCDRRILPSHHCRPTHFSATRCLEQLPTRVVRPHNRRGVIFVALLRDHIALRILTPPSGLPCRPVFMPHGPPPGAVAYFLEQHVRSPHFLPYCRLRFDGLAQFAGGPTFHTRTAIRERVIVRSYTPSRFAFLMF